MHLKSALIRGWRNYKEQKVEFAPGINLILGNNGQGKTNLLEAVYYMACGRSPRTVKLEELINWDSNYFYLKGEVCKGGRTLHVEMGAARDGRRANKIDGIPIQRLAEISGFLNAVFFMPEDLALVKGGPSERRKFLDSEISQISRRYRAALSEYKKFLRERNALLKSSGQDKILMQVLTEKIIGLSRPISRQRRGYLQKLNALARLKHRKLSDNGEELGLAYICSVEPELSDREIMGKYAELRLAERRYGSTLIGPHKDDFSFNVNGAELRTYGSQGQQRTAVLSVKLAEIELIKGETGEYPLVLLDDVFSELDAKRKGMLLEYLTDRVQTFISSTEPLPPAIGRIRLWVDKGNIRERN